ncbi:MAG TPA: type II toxin-antitoxin system VapC family toxin [Stellaceae bacterium]|nr:type II toxin-antitoxin system VapC family toxin [Stellaceae bacterium]
MRLLLDGNAFLWWREGSRRLSQRAAEEIQDSGSDIVVSIATLWEIAIKRALGKLQFLEDFHEVMRDEGFALLPITYGHLHALEALPQHHRDPFDRLLIAQALAEGIPVATADRRFGAYGVQIVW